MHVVDGTEIMPIESDIGDRIKSVEAKYHIVRVEKLIRIYVECAVILEIVLHKRQSLKLVIPVVGFVHGAGV